MKANENGKRFNAGEYVRNAIIDGLKRGVAMWRCPWREHGAAHNAISGRVYSGFNRLFLTFMCQMKGWGNSGFLTWNEIQKVGGTVRKGEHGVGIVYFNVRLVEEKGKDGNPVLDENGKPKMRRIFIDRYYKVWNVEQCEGLPEKLTAQPEAVEHNPIEAAEAVIEGFADKPEIRFAGGRAFYSPHGDYVSVPPMGDFPKVGEYYSTMFHELGHSTGHKKRLGRFDGKAEDETEYAFEELIAETVAATLCNQCGIEDTIENTTAYIDSWLKKVENDESLRGGKLLSAFSKADKAVAWILGESKEGGNETAA